MKVLIAVIALSLSGCYASYTYKRTAEGCEVTINSGRDIEVGSMTIGEDCSLNAGAKGLSGAEARALLKALVQP